MVDIEQWPTKDASKALNINYSTAKSILRNFRHTGRIDTIPKRGAKEDDESVTHYDNIQG
jgi:DNA-directed RNA polymerase specialized sigma24 family protein